ASPALVTIAGVRQILLHGANGVDAFDADSHEKIWSFACSNQHRVNCSQPIVHAGKPDRVFISTGYDGASYLIDVTKSPAAQWTTKEVWNTRGLKTKFTTAVLKDSHIYGLDDGILACVDLATGKQVWKGGRHGHGQVLLVDNLLVVQTEKGDVVLV